MFSPLERADIDAVMEIERRCFESPWTPGQFRHELKIPFSRTVLAREQAGDQRLAGYVCRWAVGDEVSILNLAVDPEFRRAGLGRALVELVVAEALERGLSQVTLEVRENNDAARTLYSALGFVQTGRRKDYYAKSDHALIMTKTLRQDGAETEVLCRNRDTGV